MLTRPSIPATHFHATNLLPRTSAGSKLPNLQIPVVVDCCHTRETAWQTISLRPPIPHSRFAAKAVRGDPLTNGFHVYWEWTADSFVQVAGGSSFAMKGTLNATLDAGTLADATLDITFVGDDWDLEETTLEEASTTQPLQVFLGNEIMVGYDAQLTGPKRYTRKVLREWFGTRAETHASGATAYVLQLGLEKPVTWSADLPEGTATYKEQPYLLAQEFDLANCPEIAVTLQKRAQRPAAPTNLHVFETRAVQRTGVREQPGSGAMGLPEFTQLDEQRSWKGHSGLFGSFATDVNQAAGAVDISHAEQAGLLTPQPAGVDGGEVHVEHRSLDAGQEAPNFVAAENGGEAFDLAGSGQGEEGPASLQGALEEELECAKGHGGVGP